MKRSMKYAIAFLSLLAMVIAMCGCEKGLNEDSVFSGELVDAQNNRVVVKNVDETMLFVTTNGTVYETQEESELCVGDQVEVSYHKKDGKFFADTVKLTAHEEESLVFGGEVTELQKNYVTVRSESLSAGFEYNEDTKIQGNLSIGDAVTITYEGNLSERPLATSIVVIEEKNEEALKSVHGTIAETGAKSILVSMDSADACRFVVNSDTIIRGDDTKLKVGDEVNLVYTGTIGDDPVARSIEIKRDKKQEYLVMDGVIDEVGDDYLIIKTAKRDYFFRIVKETRIQNKEYMEPGHKTTITYAGDLNDDPVAASIYCSKSTMTKKEKEKEKKSSKATKATKATKETKATNATKATKPTSETRKPTNAPTKPTETTEPPTEPTETTEAPTEPTETTEAPTEPTETTEAPTEPTETTEAPTEPTEPEPEPESVIIQAKGEIGTWENPCTIKIDGGGTVELDISDASISGGYIPQEGDQVALSYDKDTMKLLSLQLTYRQPE